MVQPRLVHVPGPYPLDSGRHIPLHQGLHSCEANPEVRKMTLEKGGTIPDADTTDKFPSTRIPDVFEA